MKRFISIVTLLVLAASLSAAQVQADFPYQFKADNGDLEITYTNYTATSDDTTDNWSSVFAGNVSTMVGLAREVYLYAVTTDSAALDINILLRHSGQTSLTATYVDSMITTSNTGALKVITLKDATVNRMTIYDQIKIGSVFRDSDQGTTTGRTLKWRLKFVL